MSVTEQQALDVGHTLEEVKDRAQELGMTEEEVLGRWERMAVPLTPADHLAVANRLLDLGEGQGLTAFHEEPGADKSYVFVGREGSSRVSTKQFLEFRYSQPAILGATGVIVKDLKLKQWRQVGRSLLLAKVMIDLGDEVTPRGQGRAMLRAYLDAKPPVDDRETASISEHPYVDAAGTHVFASGFRRWALHNQGDKLTRPDLAHLLRAAGCTPGKRHVATDRGRSTRQIWTAPEGLYD